jgi:oligosaccharide translocation protein RFT1
LIARILFQPIEESLRTILSPLLADPKPPSVKRAFNLFRIIFRLYCLLALIIFAVIPPLLPSVAIPILETLIGKHRFPAATLLPILYAYLFYIPLMAVNGIFESFVASVVAPSDLARQSRAMLLFSLIFLSSSWVFFIKMEMGGEGLVWANCINMTARILWSTQFAGQWIGTWNMRLSQDHKMRPISAFPRILVVFASVLVGLGIRWKLPLQFTEALMMGIVAGVTLVISMFSLLQVPLANG